MLQNPLLRAPLAVSLGAIAGALSRYYLGSWIQQVAGWDFPLGTFLVNLLGCWLMGLAATLAFERWHLSPDVRLMLTTGFLGSLTTFSSFELETSRLLDSSEPWLVWSYWLGSPVLGVVCFLIGFALAQRINRRISVDDS